MAELNPIFNAGVLVSIPLIPLFVILKRQITREDPTYRLPSFMFYLVGAIPVLSIHRDIYPQSSFRKIYFVLWLVAVSLMAAGLLQFVIQGYLNARAGTH